MENIKSIEEITERLFELVADMDAHDYEDEQEKIKSDLENALYQLKALAQNEYNFEYWRTFWNVLQRI